MYHHCGKEQKNLRFLALLSRKNVSTQSTNEFFVTNSVCNLWTGWIKIDQCSVTRYDPGRIWQQNEPISQKNDDVLNGMALENECVQPVDDACYAVGALKDVLE